MKKPKNRKERIDFIIAKLGNDMGLLFLSLTDREVKKFIDENYNWLKEKEDYQQPISRCIRCNEEVIHHTECGCGYDRAIFSEEDWKDDIESFDEAYRFSKDKEFIRNGYKMLEDIENENRNGS
ncbi:MULTISPECIES: hypothetical protein [unclassified Clostridium]|uniref:hypothetical protein n=1 Tax=unclassified Clostridium TaxID=2614128 RepID=UPI0025BDC0B1|nr:MULTISPECIES: hypothetical protein [unclassified Clostridium]